jgi:FtsP/CotA-like multicopper oxidase with cupredoxin domain
MHGEVANQVFGGLYGSIIVESDETPEVTEDRVLVISDTQFNEDGTLAEPNMMGLMMGREGDIVMVNGSVQPTGTTKKKATERWRIVNACVSRYLNLKVVGGTSHVLGFDGRKFDVPMQMNQVVVAPGNRADLIVQVTDDNVSLNYTTVAHSDMMGMGSMKNGNNSQFDNYPLFTLKAEGSEGIQLAVPTFEKNLDLTQVPVQAQRQFVLEMPSHEQMMSGMTGGFTINGEAFDMDKINTTVADGTVEEWTIVNKTTMQHPFHLHIWPMQVVDVAGTALDFVLYQDVVTVPNGSSVKVRVAFNTLKGKTLYHCHILDHEDQGMMGVIESK